jgi:hypothetical protein
MDAVRLRRVNRWQAEELCEDLADLYLESSNLSPNEGHRSCSREEFLHRLSGDIRGRGSPWRSRSRLPWWDVLSDSP